jgi:hypothetical protein
LELFLKIRGASCECVDYGLITKKGRGLFARWWGFSGFGIILQYEMMVDSVHGSWTVGGSVYHGPPGGADWRPPERGGTLAGAWSPIAPELGSSPVRVGREEGRTVKPARRSPGLDRRRDDRATTANWWRQRSLEVVMLELREEGWRMGTGGVRTGRGPQPFIGAGGRRTRRSGFNGRP